MAVPRKSSLVLCRSWLSRLTDDIEQEQLLQWTITDERPGGLHTIHVYVPDERQHRVKPSNIDLSQLSATWVLLFMAIFVPAFVYGVFYTFEAIDIWTK